MYGDWALQYGDTDYRFGPATREVELRSWAFAADSYRVDDAQLPRMDGIAFGRDFVDAGELRIELKIDFSMLPLPAADRARMAWNVRAELSRVWRADSLRAEPRALAQLVMGGTQMIEGRPRRVSFDDDHQGLGLVLATATFIPSSTAVYAVEDGSARWFEQTVGLVPAAIGGLRAPLVEPLTTARSSSRARPFAVGGGESVWPIISVQGPLQSGGQIELVNRWTLHLNRALAYDEIATIDTRPARRSMDVNGRPMNVLMPTGASISQASIPVGLNEIALRGRSLEGAASVTARWREQIGSESNDG